MIWVGREINNFFSANRYEQVVIPINDPSGRGLTLIKKGNELPRWHSKTVKSALPAETNNLIYSFELKQNLDMFMIINGWAIAKDIDSEKSQIFVVLKSINNFYQFNTNIQLRGDVGEYFNSSLYNSSGFNCAATKKGLKPGIYYVGLVLHTDTQDFFQLTDKKIAVHTPVSSLPDLAKLAIEQPNEFKYGIDVLEQTDNQLFIRGWAFLQGRELQNR